MVDEEYKKVRLELKNAKLKETKILEEIKQLHKKRPNDIYSLENKLKKLSHKYRIGDCVVLKNKEIGMIIGLKGLKMYKVQIPSVFKHSCTNEMKHEKDILCHTYDLILEKEINVKYRLTGLRG